MNPSIKHWYNKLPKIGYQMKPYAKDGKVTLPNRGKGNYDADLYFGRGCAFNGEGQNIDLLAGNSPIEADADFTYMFSNDANSSIIYAYHTALYGLGVFLYQEGIYFKIRYWEDGVLVDYKFPLLSGKNNYAIRYKKGVGFDVYTNGTYVSSKECSGVLTRGNTTSFGGRPGSSHSDCILNNVIVTTEALTPAEIAYQHTNPEKFLYHEKQADGTFVAKSEILSQDKIDNVVAHLPMTETDGYVRNMIGYSEGENIPITSIDTWTDNGDGTYSLDGTQTDRVNLLTDAGTALDGEICLIAFEIISTTAGLLKVYVGGNTSSFTSTVNVVESLEYVVIANAGGNANGRVYYQADVDFVGTIRPIIFKKLTNTYPIANYTSACRDNAKNLQSGLQTCFWKRDVLGVPIGSSFNELTMHSIDDYASFTGISMSNISQIEIVYDDSNTNIINYNKLLNLLDSNNNNIFRVERLGVGGNLYTIINTENIGKSAAISGSIHILWEFDVLNNTVRKFRNGIELGTALTLNENINVANDTIMYIGNNQFKNRNIMGVIRLFKVHETPQDPAKLYADAVKRGDLS